METNIDRIQVYDCQTRIINLRELPVYIFNTETVTTPTFSFPFKSYFFLASGFKDLTILSNIKFYNYSIVYYDVNPYAIRFKKWILSDWDGSKESLYKKIIKHEYSYALSDYKFVGDFSTLRIRDKFEHSWKIELERWKDDNMVTVLDKLRRYQNKSFMILDVVHDLKKLTEMISVSKEPIYFWFSNCFNFEHYSNDEHEDSYTKFLEVMKKSKKKIYLSGKDYNLKRVESFI